MKERTGRLRVVFLDHVARLSGGELAILRVMPALLDEIDATVVLAEDGPLAERLRSVGATVLLLPLKATIRDQSRSRAATSLVRPFVLVHLLVYTWRTSRLIRMLKPDVVHTNSLKSSLYGGVAGRLVRVSVVWQVRDRIAPDYLPRPTVALVRLAARWLPRGIVVNSRSTLDTVPAAGRRAARLGIQPVVPDSVERHQVPSRRVEGQLTVGIVGRLSPWKGQHVFLEAFALAFRETNVRARLIGSSMFGEDAYEARLRNDVTRLGIAEQVEFTGFRDDITSEFAALDITVHCSQIPEPFGQVVIEAMAAGSATIASNEGGPAEVITDGVDGLLVPPRVQDLAVALEQLAHDPALRERLALAGRQTSQEYSPTRTADGLLAVYRAVLRRPRLTP